MADLNNQKQAAKALNQEMQYVLDAVVSIGDKLVNGFKEAVDEAVELGDVTETLGNTLKKGYSKDLRDVAKVSEELIKAQAKQNKGLLKSSEIEKLKIKLLESQALKEARVNIAKANGVALDDEQLKALNEQIELQEKALEAIEKENKSRGISGGLVDKLKQKIADIRPPDIGRAVLAYMVKILKEIDTEVVNLQRGFALTKGEAIELNQELARTALEARTLGVNLESVTKATNTLNSALGGTANIFTTEIRNDVAFLQERLKLSDEAAAELAKTAFITGKSVKQVGEEQEAVFKAVKATTGVTLNFKQTLEEANKIGGALRLKMDALPGGIIEAVAQAKSLGIEFSKIEGIQSSLLDFEQSIAKELKAEALIGREINLERARLAALNDDAATLAKEISSQFGSIAEFQNLSVIQQQAYADALGMSRNELAESLKTQESINSQIETGVESQGESLTQNTAALSAQEALNQSINQLNTTLKTSLALVVGIASAAAVIATGGLAAIPLALGVGAGAGLGTAGIQAVMDGTAPSSKGPFTITDSYGETAVTSAGDNVVVSPNVSSGNEGITRAQASEMISLLKVVANKEFSVSMDGRKLASAMQTSGVSYSS
jgi:phosphopantetheine adenylyltransferase